MDCRDAEAGPSMSFLWLAGFLLHTSTIHLPAVAESMPTMTADESSKVAWESLVPPDDLAGCADSPAGVRSPSPLPVHSVMVRREKGNPVSGRL